MTPMVRRNSFGGRTTELLTPHSYSGPRGRFSTTPFNFVALSKEDTSSSSASLSGSELGFGFHAQLQIQIDRNELKLYSIVLTWNLELLMIVLQSQFVQDAVLRCCVCKCILICEQVCNNRKAVSAHSFTIHLFASLLLFSCHKDQQN